MSDIANPPPMTKTWNSPVMRVMMAETAANTTIPNPIKRWLFRHDKSLLRFHGVGMPDIMLLEVVT